MTSRRVFVLLLSLTLLTFALPTPAFAQATRTWVSGVGDDANPCSRTAPCKTFAGAISKTATNGEINCLDPGGFGGVTITKSLKIICDYTEGGVLVSGTNAIVVNATDTSDVTISGLDINGLGTSLNAIRVLRAKSVKITNVRIHGFTRNGIDFEPATVDARLFVSDVRVYENNGAAVFAAPTALTGTSRVTVEDSDLIDDGCGVAATSELADASYNYSTRCGTAAAGDGSRVTVNVFRSTIDENLYNGLYTNGNAAIRVAASPITGNARGINTLAPPNANSGVFTFGDNYLLGNATNGAFTGTLSPE